MIQLQVLNKILQDKDSSLIILNNLDDSYFSDYKAEFNYIKNHLNTYGNVCDQESFLNVFPEFPIVNVTESDQFLIKELVQEKNKNYLAKNFNEIRLLLLDNKIDDAAAILKQAADDMSKAVSLQAVDLANQREWPIRHFHQGQHTARPPSARCCSQSDIAGSRARSAPGYPPTH